ncbi:MAG: M48 family metalloprotease [Acidiferrobacterales bacterium]|nr:M48 family metalloprotease [Acidiferrobacterales bacterium]
MSAKQIRCENDLSLYEKLKKHADVRRVNDMIKRREAEGPTGIRRNLLATSVRLTKGMAPDIVEMAEQCVDQLGVEIPLEIYVYSSPQFNAACFKPENDRLNVMFSSSLLEGFNPTELKFVMGHELGHHVYDHHAIPIGHLLRGQDKPDPKLALELFTWSRYAEISADRAGAICAQDMNAVAHSLFKLSSGLSTKIVQFSLDDFVAQADDMQVGNEEHRRTGPQADWFSTHPFSPLRVKALKLFEQSKLYRKKGSTLNKVALEVGVQGVLSLMEPSYLEAKTDTAETMRRLLFSGLIAVADAENGISEKELDIFAKFFGKYAFTDKLDVKKIKNTVVNRAKEVAEKASQTQCMQVLRDICVMARANGGVHTKERKVLEQVAENLNIPSTFICQNLEGDTDLD